MAETFFGPWHLTATTQEGQFTEFFVITGSDSSDGLYEPADNGTPFSTTVTGDEWTIEFQATFGSNSEMFAYDPARGTRTLPQQGLTVQLASPRIDKPSGDVFAHLLVVELVSQDPQLSPPWVPPPFDFTVPKG